MSLQWRPMVCGVSGDCAARLSGCDTSSHRHLSHKPVPPPCHPISDTTNGRTISRLHALASASQLLPGCFLSGSAVAWLAEVRGTGATLRCSQTTVEESLYPEMVLAAIHEICSWRAKGLPSSPLGYYIYSPARRI